MVGDPRSMTLIQAVAWCAALYFMLNIATVALAVAWPGRHLSIVHVGAVHLFVISMLSYAVVRVYDGGRLVSSEMPLWRERLGLTRACAKALWLGAGLGFAIKYPADALRVMVEEIAPTPPYELAMKEQLLRHDSVAQVIALFLIIGLLGPLLEELFYRGVIFRYVERARGAAAAWWLTSLAFTITHASFRDWPSLLMVAAVLGFLRWRFASIGPSVVGHVVFNGIALLALTSGVPIVEHRPEISWLALFACCLMLLGLLVAAVRSSPGARSHD